MLALLVARAGQTVQVEQLTDGLWGDAPPRRARKTVQVYVANLRRALGPGAPLRSEPGGYRLAVGRDDVDALRFDDLLARARLRGDVAGYDAALALWRGDPYADLPASDALAPEIVRLDEARAAAEEERAALVLDAGGAAGAIAELEALVRRRPLRERPWALLMRALYLAGRQADALAAYRRVRDRLVDELGVEPGPELAAMERRVLAQDPTLAPGAGPATARRQITVVCCGVTGVGELVGSWDLTDTVDLLGRFTRAAADAAVAHGGVVVSSATAVVVAYFGLTTVAPDTAPLAAVQAGLAVVAAVAALTLDGLPQRPRAWGAQVGIDSGVALTPARPSPSIPPVGDVPVLADRMRATARPGQVLVTSRTAALLGGRVGLGTPADRRAGGGDGPVVGLPIVPGPDVPAVS